MVFKKFFLLVLLIPAIFLAYVFLKNRWESNSGDYLFYNELSGNWQKTNKKPTFDSKTLNQENDSGFKNASVIRGFFDHYDKENDFLYIKSVIPFSNDQLYELKVMKIGMQQQFYCVQSKIFSEKTGKVQPTRIYRFPVYDGEILYTYYEKTLSLDDFLKKANSETWIFLQLTEPYSETQNNYLYKLVAVGLCE